MSSISESRARIDAWLAAHAPATLALLNPPVQPTELETAQHLFGMPFPADLDESLSWHNGASEWTSVLPEQSPLGATALATRAQICVQIASSMDGMVVEPLDEEPWWHPLWVPWAESADGNVQVLDLREGGRLGWAGHSSGGDFSSSWPGLADYLHEVALALYDGGGVRGLYPHLTRTGTCGGDRTV